MSTKEVGNWVSAQVKERLDNKDPDEIEYEIRSSQILPDEVIEVLIILKRNYDPTWTGAPEHYDTSEDSSTVEDMDRWKEIIARWKSKALGKATRTGNDRVSNSYLGVVEQETGIDELDAKLRFVNWVTREAGITYLAGHMGTGKTDFGLLMMQTFYKAYKRDETDVQLATNIESTAEYYDHIKYIDNQPDLQKWLDETDGYKLFLFDEASSHATGYSGDAKNVTQQFRSMIRLIRKSDGNMIIVGHDGKDLHPTVRELADYVEKQGHKDAIVFEGVEDREGTEEKFEISKIPETKYWYNTKEASEWEWASEDEDGKSLEVIIGQTYVETELVQEDVAEIFEVSQSKVSECKKQYQEWSGAEA